MGVAPACDFRDDGGIPRSPRGGDCPCDVVGEDARQDNFYPPPPSLQVEAAGGLTKVSRECAGARYDIEQDVPLGPQNHQRAEPDIGIQAVTYDVHHEHWKCEICWKRGQKLCERLYSLGEFWPQSDPDADRHPD